MKTTGQLIQALACHFLTPAQLPRVQPDIDCFLREARARGQDMPMTDGQFLARLRALIRSGPGLLNEILGLR